MNDREEYLYSVRNKRDPHKESREILIYSLVLAVYLFLSVFMNNFVLTTVIVDGDSMQPTLQDTDVLYMNKLKTPKYGDIIIVKPYDNSDDWYVKRAEGFEGDKIYWADGALYRESGGTAVKIRSNVNKKERFTSVTVGKGQVFFLGDNINNSTDSRDIGSRSLTDVIGVVPSWSVKHKENISKVFYFLNYNLKQS